MARNIGNGLNLQGQKITSLGDGSLASDAATWGQVQAFIAGLSWKSSVRVASTGNVSLSAPGASIDGVTLAVNDRVLLKNQTAAAENGIYVWTASGSALTRATDMDTAAETQSATVLVREGTAGADTAWTQTADAVTLGTTSLTFVQFAAGASSYTAGNGLQLISTAFSVKLPTNPGLIADGTGLYIQYPAGGGLTVDATGVYVKLPASSGLIKDATGLYIDTSIVTRKYAAHRRDGTTTAITVTHGLNTRDVQVAVYDLTTFADELPDVARPTTGTVTLTYAVAPTTGRIRCVVQG